MSFLFRGLLRLIWRMVLFGDEMAERSAKLGRSFARTSGRSVSESVTKWLREQR